uniref:Uncharacterized protein n=1 Tax=Falco tinnunculus TaxID=100819 RepID=A0A8C4URP8_FALTI
WDVLRLDFFFIFNDHLKGTSNFHCEQSQVFRMFIHMIKARKILLIGKLKGYSILAIAEELPDDGKIFACAEAPYLGVNSQEAFDYSSDGKKISMRVGPMADTLEASVAEFYSMWVGFVSGSLIPNVASGQCICALLSQFLRGKACSQCPQELRKS